MVGFKGEIESILRPIYEFNVVFTIIIVSFLIIYFNSFFLLNQKTSLGLVAFILLLGLYRFMQGYKIYKYQKNLVRLPFYSLSPENIPGGKENWFLGKGFEWTQKHTQRIYDLKLDKYEQYRNPSKIFQIIRKIEKQYPNWRFFYNQHWFNPYHPLPEVGGNPIIHAVGMFEGEEDVFLPEEERKGNTLVIGSTGVGKTRLAETLVIQDIHNFKTTIFFDPKGDAEIMVKMYIESIKLGRPIYIFHLGYPEISCRYNAVGSFTKITEVAGRISDQLPADGNSTVFRDFAWGFINIVSMALVKCGDKPTFSNISNYINNINPLIKLYRKKVIEAKYPNFEKTLKILKDKYLKQERDGKVFYKQPPQGKEEECFLINKWQEDYNINDDRELLGILTVFRYDNAYYSKLVASLRPLLDKLTSGKVAELLSPKESKQDHRPIINWEQVIRQNAVVYVGLDALSDTTVSHAVGAAMFADITSLAGKFYKEGRGHQAGNQDICIHADEFNELIGDQFIPLINKARGAGFKQTAYTQSSFDVEAGIGSKAKAGVIFDNFNNVIYLRIKSKETAAKFLDQVGEVEIQQITSMSQTTDSSKIDDDIHFTGVVREQITTKTASIIATDDLIKLPKGQAFCIIDGGKLFKIRIPRPKKSKFKNSNLPSNLEEMYQSMIRSYSSEIDYQALYKPADAD